MTGKVPVERTITEAYRFGFTRILSVLGTVWLPYLILALLIVGLVFLVSPDLPRLMMANDLDTPALMSLGRLAVLVGILGFIVSAMVSVGLQRLALGLEPRPVYFFFSLGAPVWRMTGALFLAMLVVFIVALIVIAAGTAIWFAASGLGGAMWLVRVLAVLAGLCLWIYVAVRLFFFLPAVVVAEESIGIERAWNLGGHNFWRILIVATAVVLPIVVVFYIVSLAIFPRLPDLPGGHMGSRELIRTLFLQFGALGIAGLLFQIVERVVILAVFNSAIGKAYLAVTGEGAAPAPAAAPAAV